VRAEVLHSSGQETDGDFSVQYPGRFGYDKGMDGRIYFAIVWEYKG